MHSLDSLLKYAEYAKRLLHQIALCIRVYNHEHRIVDGKLTIAQIADDIQRLYSQATSPVVIRVPARAVAINSLLGYSALIDMLRAHVSEREFFVNSQVRHCGVGADVEARMSPFWTDVQDMCINAEEWYGMGLGFRNISFNVLGVDNGLVHEVSGMNHNIRLWKGWSDQVKGSRHDIPFEFNDNKMPSEQSTTFPFGVNDPRPQQYGGSGSDFHTGPQPRTSEQSSSSTGARGSGAQGEQQQQQQSRPDPSGPKKPTRSNLNMKFPPTPVMFSEDSMSADEDDQLTTKTNEWSYPAKNTKCTFYTSRATDIYASHKLYKGSSWLQISLLLLIRTDTTRDYPTN